MDSTHSEIEGSAGGSTEVLIVPELEELVNTTLVQWSEWETAVMEKYYKLGVPTDAIAKALGRTKEAVKARASSMGCGRPKNTPKEIDLDALENSRENYHHWSQDEIEILAREYRANTPVSAIAKALGRTTSSVRCKVQSLGLRRL